MAVSSWVWLSAPPPPSSSRALAPLTGRGLGAAQASADAVWVGGSVSTLVVSGAAPGCLWQERLGEWEAIGQGDATAHSEGWKAWPGEGLTGAVCVH